MAASLAALERLNQQREIDEVNKELNAEGFLRSRNRQRVEQTRRKSKKSAAGLLGAVVAQAASATDLRRGESNSGMEAHASSANSSEDDQPELIRSKSFIGVVSAAVTRWLGGMSRSEGEVRQATVAKLLSNTRKWLCINVYGLPLRAEQRPAHVQELPRHSWRRYKHDVHTLLTESDSSLLARVLSWSLLLVILLSTVMLCIETLPHFQQHAGEQRILDNIEMVCIQIFAAEYLARFATSPARVKFLVAPLNLLDVLCVLPWYVLLATQDRGVAGLQVFRVLRLVRVLRVLKVGGKVNKLGVVAAALRESADVLLLMVVFISLMVVFFSTLIFFCEQGSWVAERGQYERPGEVNAFTRSPYSSVPESFWWCIVTLMTVGYGDVVPVTVGGKLVACVTMVVAVVVMAMPISVVGTNFTTLWMDHKAVTTALRQNRMLPPTLLKLCTCLREYATAAQTLTRLQRHSADRLVDAKARVEDRLLAIRTQLEAENRKQESWARTADRVLGRPQFLDIMVNMTAQPGDPSYIVQLGDESTDALVGEMQDVVSDVQSLLRASSLLSRHNFPDMVKELRLKYRDVEFLDEATQDMKKSMRDTHRQVREMQAWLEDMKAVFGVDLPQGFMQSRVLPRSHASVKASAQAMPGGQEQWAM